MRRRRRRSGKWICESVGEVAAEGRSPQLTFSTIEHSKETRRVEQRIRLRESSLLFLNQPIRIRFSGERGHCLLKISTVTCFYMVKSRSIIGSACQASMY
ncbi:unnamed protein product [Urochloa humidicola]